MAAVKRCLSMNNKAKTMCNMVSDKIHLIMMPFCLFFLACSTEKKFDFPINEIESIKYFNDSNEPFYKSLQMTPVHFRANSDCSIQEVVSSFIYKEKTASLKLIIDYEANVIRFSSVGEESDYFVFAISELFEVSDCNPKMKENLECSFYDLEPADRCLLGNKQEYKLSYFPNPESEKGSAQMYLMVYLDQGKIDLTEKHSGLAKENFVRAFEAE